MCFVVKIVLFAWFCAVLRYKYGGIVRQTKYYYVAGVTFSLVKSICARPPELESAFYNTPG